MLRVWIELPACDIDDRAVRKADDAVSIGGRGPRGWIRGRCPVPANPRRGGSDSERAEFAGQGIGRNPTLVVGKQRIGESPVASKEVVDVFAHENKDEVDNR